jgi:hypothetical protein
MYGLINIDQFVKVLVEGGLRRCLRTSYGQLLAEGRLHTSLLPEDCISRKGCT